MYPTCSSLCHTSHRPSSPCCVSSRRPRCVSPRRHRCVSPRRPRRVAPRRSHCVAPRRPCVAPRVPRPQPTCATRRHHLPPLALGRTPFPRLVLGRDATSPRVPHSVPLLFSIFFFWFVFISFSFFVDCSCEEREWVPRAAPLPPWFVFCLFFFFFPADRSLPLTDGTPSHSQTLGGLPFSSCCALLTNARHDATVSWFVFFSFFFLIR